MLPLPRSLCAFWAALLYLPVVSLPAHASDGKNSAKEPQLVLSNEHSKLYYSYNKSGFKEGVRWTYENSGNQVIRATSIKVAYTCSDGRETTHTHYFGKELLPGQKVSTLGRFLPCGEALVSSAQPVEINSHQPEKPARNQSVDCKGERRNYQLEMLRDNVLIMTTDDGRKYTHRAEKDSEGRLQFGTDGMMAFICEDETAASRDQRDLHRTLSKYLEEKFKGDGSGKPDRRYRLQPLGGFGGGRS